MQSKPNEGFMFFTDCYILLKRIGHLFLFVLTY
jgi:hypothetical protein